MGEDGKMTVEIKDVAVALLEGQFGSNGGAADRKDGKLSLRRRQPCNLAILSSSAATLAFSTRLSATAIVSS